VPRETLTASVASATPLLQGALLILMLSIVAAATVSGERAILGVGAWSSLLLLVYLLCLVVVRATRGREPWVPQGRRPPANPGNDEMPGGALSRLLPRTALGAAAILVAGYALAQSGDALAEQTGLGANFFGAVFLALSTSLPEITIVFSSVLRGRYAMAVSNIFGANLFGLAMIFLVDAVYIGEPVLALGGRFAAFAALLGSAVTALFIAGLLERRHGRIWHMGWDSLLVIGTYCAGLALLYRLR
jgi:cation:H+ antiporter